jgi:FkbH-like protein
MTEQITMRFLVFRDATVEPIFFQLRKQLLSEGKNVEFEFSGVDSAVQDALSLTPHKVRAERYSGFIIFFSKFALSTNLNNRFPLLDDEALDSELALIRERYESVAQAITRLDCSAIKLIMDIESYARPHVRMSKNRQFFDQNDVVKWINVSVIQSLCERELFKKVSINSCLLSVGESNFYDYRYWYHAKSPYSSAASKAISNELFRLLIVLFGMKKKCLVLDCDNTLWGGVVGEEGVHGIQLAPSGFGQPFYDFQNYLKSLCRNGVILTLCSKNNPEDIDHVFSYNTNMRLSEQDISFKQVNWENKADNIKRIANALNIGLDTLVFVDDSEFETQMVGQLLPEVQVIKLDPAKPSEYIQKIKGTGLFEIDEVLSEDLAKASFYMSQAKRNESKSSLNLNDYLQSLGTVAIVKEVEETDVPRIAQLSQKTNQFNLTTTRLSQEQIQHKLQSCSNKIFKLSASDNFGDLGIVGYCLITHCAEYSIMIDNIVISCRALGRDLEKAFAYYVLNNLKRDGINHVVAHWIKSERNNQCENFWPSMGFYCQDESDIEKIFVLDLKKFNDKSPSHISIN